MKDEDKTDTQILLEELRHSGILALVEVVKRTEKRIAARTAYRKAQDREAMEFIHENHGFDF